VKKCIALKIKNSAPLVIAKSKTAKEHSVSTELEFLNSLLALETKEE
jgi:hypothetical protein